MSEVIQALRMISERDPQGIPCGPNAEDCECGCIGCIARAALKNSMRKENDPLSPACDKQRAAEQERTQSAIDGILHARDAK